MWKWTVTLKLCLFATDGIFCGSRKVSLHHYTTVLPTKTIQFAGQYQIQTTSSVLQTAICWTWPYNSFFPLLTALYSLIWWWLILWPFWMEAEWIADTGSLAAAVTRPKFDELCTQSQHIVVMCVVIVCTCIQDSCSHEIQIIIVKNIHTICMNYYNAI